MGYTHEMPVEPKRINIVETIHSSETVHCHSFVESVCSARSGGEAGITLYAGSRASLPPGGRRRRGEPRSGVTGDRPSARRGEMKTVLPSVIASSFENDAGHCRSFVKSRCRTPSRQIDFATGKK